MSGRLLIVLTWVGVTLSTWRCSGDLRRIDRALYDKPSFNGLTQKPAVPNPMAVINAVARRDQIRVLADGTTAANDLGFANAVPARVIVHAVARLGPIKLGAMDISFKPTAASKLFWGGRTAMRLVQALHWLRDTWAREPLEGATGTPGTLETGAALTGRALIVWASIGCASL